MPIRLLPLIGHYSGLCHGTQVPVAWENSGCISAHPCLSRRSHHFRYPLSDFYIWTFIYDVSGMKSVLFNYRMDKDGVNPIDDNANEVHLSGMQVASLDPILKLIHVDSHKVRK